MASRAGNDGDSGPTSGSLSMGAVTAASHETVAGEASITNPGGLGDTDQRPDRIGRYVVLDRIGAGGMGVVFAAFDPELDRKVAIKVLHTDSTRSADSRQRLVREAQAMARLSHPNVVTVHDVGEHDDQVFLAMEYIEGRTLGAWLDAEKPSVPEILGMFVQAGRGLAAAHARELVHRDFKPDNVMVGNDGRVRVMDFGVARGVETDEHPTEPMTDLHSGVSARSSALSARVTRMGALVGTPAYMAPEQWRGEAVDARTDQFALCVALYEALSGRRPFDDKGGIQGLALEVTSGTPRSLVSDRPIPSTTRRAIERGLAQDPADRWPTVASLLDELQKDPARIRRRAMGAAAVLVIAGLATGGWQLRKNRQVAECDTEARAAQEIWTDESKAALHEAMVATGVSYARDTYGRLVPILDRRVEQWAQVRRSVCMDRSRRERLTQAQNELATRCLDERLREISTYVEALGEGGPDAVKNAIVAASDIRSPEQCHEESGLGAFALPDDPQQRAAVEAASNRRRHLARAVTLADYETAERELPALLAEVDSTGWLPLLAQTRLLSGQVAQTRGRLEDAQGELRAAFVAAVSSGQDVLAGEAAEKLAQLHAIELLRFDEADFWIEVAEGIQTRAGNTRDGDLERIRAIVLSEVGDIERAQRAIERAEALAVAMYGPDHPYAAIVMQTACPLYTDAGRYDEALACERRALQMQRDFLGPMHPNVATALHNIGTLHARKGELTEAREALGESVRIRQEAVGNAHPDLGRGLSALAVVAAMAGDLEEAERQFQRSIEAFEVSGGPRSVLVAHSLGNLAQLHLDLGRADEAREEALRSLEILEEQLGPEHDDVGQPVAVLAAAYTLAGNYEEAEALHRREIAIHTKDEGGDPVPPAVARLGLASVLAKTNRTDEALELAEGARQVIEDRLGVQHPYVAAAHAVLSEIHQRRDDYETALGLARTALSLRQSILGADNYETAHSLVRVGELELEAGNVQEAMSSLRQAAEVFTERAMRAEAAGARFALAKAQWAAGERDVAATTARAAADGYRSLGDSQTARIADVEAWLASRR